jgi:chorismate lyase
MPPTGQRRAWLTDRGSLTARIVAHHAEFNLRRVMQARALPFADERRALNLRKGELAIVREVILQSGATPLVFAHTAVHPRALRGAWRALSRLGAKPLAEVLFHDPLVSRMPMEYLKLTGQHALLQRANAVLRTQHNALWARRSVFLRHGTPLLVTEVFLPSILQSRED